MYSNENECNRFYLSKYIVNNPHCDYPFKVDFSVLFTNEEKNIRKQIVDKNGNILDFPGVEYSKQLKEELGRRVIEPVVKYEAIFQKVDDSKLIMVWTVRPDGRYWMDSWGFGAEDYESLSLYTYIDAEGNFISPFKLYSIGYQHFGDCRLKEDRK